MQDFQLKPLQRVTLRNGHEAIVVQNPGRGDGTDALFFIFSADNEGWMPAVMSYSGAAPEWDVVAVYDEPHLIRDLLSFNRKGDLLWKEPSSAVKVAQADVTRAKADLEAAEKRLADALAAA